MLTNTKNIRAMSINVRFKFLFRSQIKNSDSNVKELKVNKIKSMFIKEKQKPSFHLEYLFIVKTLGLTYLNFFTYTNTTESVFMCKTTIYLKKVRSCIIGV